MKANINTVNGIKEVEIEKKPFKVQGVWLFVHKDEDAYGLDYYIISEWQTGWQFSGAEDKEAIRISINRVFEKIPHARIQDRIKEAIEKYGIANEGIPEEAEK